MRKLPGSHNYAMNQKHFLNIMNLLIQNKSHIQLSFLTHPQTQKKYIDSHYQPERETKYSTNLIHEKSSGVMMRDN